MKKTICILCGGRSPEHEVSLVSSEFIYKNIDRDRFNIVVMGICKDSGKWRFYSDKPYKTDNSYSSKLLDTGYREVVFSIGDKDPLLVKESNGFLNLKIDLFFPILHGVNCEDGTLQGLLEQLGICFIGAKTLDSALCMDKDLAKVIVKASGVPVVDSFSISDIKCLDLLDIDFPIFVKPSRSGSSIGISKVTSKDFLLKAVEEAFKYSETVLLEKAIDAREFECAILGDWNKDFKISNIGEIIPKDEYYSYKAKYLDSNGAKLVLNPKFSEKLKIKNYAKTVYKALKCHGLARIDFFMDKKSKKIFFNEINTIPGFTSISMYPSLWKDSGIDAKDLINSLIDISLNH